MPTRDWQTNDSMNDETIGEYNFVNCIDITSKKTEFNKLKVRDLSLIDPYSDISLTVVNILKAKDISVDEIELENHIDTDGVIEFIKPIYVENASIQEIRAYDGSFSSITVENRINFSLIEAKTDNIITINSDASFYNNIQSNDICVNKISNRINEHAIHIMSDVSINKKLNVEDISVSHINKLYNTIVFNSDVSMKDVLYASDFSGEIFRVRELSANNIYGSNDRIEFIADISNNNSIKIQEISLNTLGKDKSKITIMNNLLVEHDLKIGGELSLNNLYTNNQYINFNDNTILTYGIEKPDISINIINPSEPPNQSIVRDQSNVLIINSDVSFNSTADLDWVNSAFNVIAPYDSITDVIKKNNEFVTGSLIEIKNTDDNNKSKVNIYIKIDDDSWHKIVDANNSPWFKRFSLSYEGIDMLTDDIFKQDISNTNNLDNKYLTIPENSVTDISVGLQDYVSDFNFSSINTIKYYVKKIKSEEDHTYNLRTVVEDLELDDLTLLRRKNTGANAINALSYMEYMNSFSDFCYNYGGGWEVRLSTGDVDISDEFKTDVTYTEISNLDIKVPINNGFDASFILEVRDDINVTLNPKLIYIIKVNEVPKWTELKLDASNYVHYLHKGTQLINEPSEHKREGLVGMYNDISFDVSYDKPTISNYHDTSYYDLDLSAIDPEGFDVSYYIEDKDDFNDWSWNWSADNSNILKIKVPGEGINGIDVSLVILAHDNNVPDVSNLIPNDLYRDDGIETSYNRTIITFRKENAQPIWNCIKLGVSNDQFDELDQSWNDNIDTEDSHQFYVYFEPDKKYVQQKNENFSTDLSSYFLDLSSTDPEGFDSSYYVLDPKSDISHIITNDYSRIQIDISSLLTTYDTGYDMSLEIVSQDDWSYNFVDKRDHSRIYNTRILNFKHISSRLLEEIEYQDISSTTDSQLYNVNDNSYEILYSKNNKNMQITLSFDYNQFPVALTDLSIVNTEFSEYDISLVRQSEHNVIDISGIVEVYTDNNRGYIDFSFDLLFKETFKYNFFITNYYLTGGDGSFSDITASNITIKDSEDKSNVNPLLQVFGDISATGRFHANDGSFNLNVDISNKLIVEEDISINNRLDAHDASFHNDVTIGNDLLVVGDVSINYRLDTHDASFQNDVTIANDLVVGNDVSINKHLSVYDASFHSDATIANDLIVNENAMLDKNYIVNGTFNTGYDTDWVITTDNGSESTDTPNYINLTAVSTIKQDLSLVPDASYYVTFDASGGPSGISIKIGGETITTIDASYAPILSETDVKNFSSGIFASEISDVSLCFESQSRFTIGNVNLHRITTLTAPDASFHNNVNVTNHLLVKNDVSINNHLTALQGGSGISHHSNNTIPSLLPSGSSNISIDGTWLHVRHIVATNEEEGVINDNLQGANVVGTPSENASNWSIKFDDIDYDQMLFFADDNKKWGIIEKTNFSLTLQSLNFIQSYKKSTESAGTYVDGDDGDQLLITSPADSSYIYADKISNTNIYLHTRPFDVYIRLSPLSPSRAVFRNDVTIANDLVVENDVSINTFLSAMDTSFHHDVTIVNDLVVEGDVSINHDLDCYDASFHTDVTIANDLVVENDVSINNFLSAIDTSFHRDVTIANDLYVGGDVSINHHLDGYDASFHADVTIANDLVVENDVSINNFLSVMDASFHHDVTIANDLYVGRDVSINNFLSAMDSSFHTDVTIGKNLVVERDVSINNRLDVYDASFQNNVTVAKDLLVINDVSINGILSVVDMSFDNYDVNVGNDISCRGVLKAPQVFAGTGPFTEVDNLDSSYVFVGSNSNSDAVMRLEGTDGSGCEIVGSGSGDSRFGINIINDAATSKSDVLTISKEGNVGINNTSPTVKLDVGGNIAATDISGLGVIPIGGIIIWNSNTIPDGWAICNGDPTDDGTSTPDLTAKFVMGFSNNNNQQSVEKLKITTSHIPQHSHSSTTTALGDVTVDNPNTHTTTTNSSFTTSGGEGGHAHTAELGGGLMQDNDGGHHHGYFDKYRQTVNRHPNGKMQNLQVEAYDSGTVAQSTNQVARATSSAQKGPATTSHGGGNHTHTFTSNIPHNTYEHSHTEDNGAEHVQHNHSIDATDTGSWGNDAADQVHTEDPPYIKLIYIMRYK